MRRRERERECVCVCFVCVCVCVCVCVYVLDGKLSRVFASSVVELYIVVLVQ